MVHVPVLLNEVVDFLRVSPGGIYVDGTLGGGGHAEAIFQKMGTGIYVGIDRDAKILEQTKAQLQKKSVSFYGVHDVFSNLPEILKSLEIEAVDGILLDLGVSSFQLDEAERGFSFLHDAPLDMRMDSDSEEENAADILNTYSEKDLAEIFYKFGEERFSRRIAREIVAFRRAQPFVYTSELARVVSSSIPARFARSSKIHPATRVFQGLRIAVNQELYHLEKFLGLDFSFLKSGGRICVISFHSLEDRLVKHAFRRFENFKIITKRPVLPSEEEMRLNPRARSAKLRVIEKV